MDMSDDGSVFVLEQFHGPTCAFKDVALQFLGNLFEFFLERASDNNIAAGKEGWYMGVRRYSRLT